MFPLSARLTGSVISLKLVPSQVAVSVALTMWFPGAVNVVFNVAPEVVDPAGGGWPSTVKVKVGAHSPVRVAVKVTSSLIEGDAGLAVTSVTTACAEAGRKRRARRASSAGAARRRLAGRWATSMTGGVRATFF